MGELTEEDLAGLGMTTDSFAGRVVIITGSGQGIGRALALFLARLGAKVVVAELADSGREVADQIAQTGHLSTIQLPVIVAC